VKKDKVTWIVMLTPLVLALAGWVNARAEREKAETELMKLSNGYQQYIEMKMEQGCEIE